MVLSWDRICPALAIGLAGNKMLFSECARTPARRASTTTERFIPASPPTPVSVNPNPSWIAFARENGTVYHTYTVSAPDPFVAPYYSSLLERTPKAQPAEPRSWRKDEYPQ